MTLGNDTSELEVPPFPVCSQSLSLFSAESRNPVTAVFRRPLLGSELRAPEASSIDAVKSINHFALTVR